MSFDQKISIFDLDGKPFEVKIGLEDYAAAAEAELTLGQFYARKYPTNMKAFGSPLEQMMVSVGAFLSADKHLGYSPPTMKSLIEGGANINMSSITRPDGTQNNTPAGRYFFPAILLEVIQSALETNHSPFISGFNRMVALRRSISQPRYDQVIVNTSGPRSGVAQPIGQLQNPTRILSFTTSSTQKTIPQYAVGMEISEQAMKAATLDQIAFSMREFMLQEQVDVIKRDIKEFVNGSTDSGQTALTSVTAQSFDPAIVAAGAITQKAWVKWLYEEDEKRQITDVI